MIRKHPLAVLDYLVDWSNQLAGDTITDSTFTVDSGDITLTGATHDTTSATVFLNGGTDKTYARVTNLITTAGGRTYPTTFTVKITTRPAIVDVSTLKTSILPGLRLEDSKGRPLPDSVIQERIDAAISSLQRKHSVRFEETVIKLGRRDLPDEPTADERYNGATYDPESNNGWNNFQVPITPILEDLSKTNKLAIHAVGLWIPTMSQDISTVNGIFKLPTSWAVSDDHGWINLIPDGTPFVYAQWGYVLRTFGTNSIQNGWHLTYTAGYTAEQLEAMPDIPLNLAKLAALEILTPGSVDRFLAKGVTGQSVSVDGLSQSVQLMQNANALKYAALAAQYSAEFTAWEDTFFGKTKGFIFGML